MRLLGGLGMRDMGITHFLHWELGQSVEAYLGFSLENIVLGACPLQALPFSLALLTLDIVVVPAGNASLMLKDIASMSKRVSGPADSQLLAVGVCTGSLTKMVRF